MANIEQNRYNHVDAVREGNSKTSLAMNANTTQPNVTIQISDSLTASLNLISSSQKWWIAIMLGILFALLSMPFMYIFIDHLLCPVMGASYSCGGPSLAAILINAVIFTIIVRLLLI